ncbi:hypothetical protein V1639_00610 [Pseudarthrobacter sp. J75]|uniref:hypothetical protein n=1 Tax=unclassified Pseudarthrobacter TaxID=2647000 RepID=UPI002E815650|nr:MULTISPECIES: hypothetical protein [unclassified Pseudarthrobacter]MEE2527529.1 hypothetical protein [Pseudarthrobacter sp. J75]MEE2569774.1 hypothetical protein [Pseudarthrobacter sp. J64]
MTYFLEYTVPASADNAEFEIPHDEINTGETIPLTETGAEVIHATELPARTAIVGATTAEAKIEAEQLLLHSRATTGELYDDPSASLNAGVGKLLATYNEGDGWTDVDGSSSEPARLPED